MPPPVGRGNKCCFCPSVGPSVCPSVRYIANNSRTLRPDLEGKFPTLDATHIPVSRLNDQRSGLEAGRGIPCRPNPVATLLVIYFIVVRNLYVAVSILICSVLSLHLSAVV